MQDIQDIVPGYMLIHLCANHQNRPGTAVAETVVPFQDHITLQLVVFKVLLNQLQGLLVPPAEAGASQAYLYLFSNQCHNTARSQS